MDIATIVGVIAAFGLVVGSILMGGAITLFINVPALMVVVGGTIGATLINYPLGDVLKVFNIARNAIFSTKTPVNETIERFVDYANKSRKEGILALEGEIKTVKDAFLINCRLFILLFFSNSYNHTIVYNHNKQL